jgi:predicted membrane protein
MAVYVTIYSLLPRLVLNRNYHEFIFGYILILLAAGIFQRVFIHLFYENLLLNVAGEGLFSMKMLLRAVILINTTVFFVLGIKLFQMWVVAFENSSENGRADNIVLRSNRRVHRVNFGEILFIEGLGNYVKYQLADGSKITSYGSIKKALEALPEDFIRVHKSFIINRHKIKSYDAVSIQVMNHSVPRGKGVSDEALTP